MDLKTKRLNDYQLTQLFPINIIEESKKKKLSISLNLFKICQGFPKEEIGKFKIFQKNQEKDIISNLLYKKSYSSLDEESLIEVKKLLSKRASTPTRTSPYIKFLVKSLLKTMNDSVIFSSFEQEINEGWVFSYNNKKYDITTNKEKILTENCIYIDPEMIFDKISMIKPDCIINILSYFKNIEFDSSLINEVNNQVNKTIENYKKLYSLDKKIIEMDLKKRENSSFNQE